MNEQSRVTNRIGDYERRRAVALDGNQRAHDLLLEARLRNRHGHTATGYRAFLIRRALTQLATRTAAEGGSILPK